MFYATRNVTEIAVEPCSPWEFVLAVEPGAQVRHDKQARQEWYQNTATVHQFYTSVEGSNPNQRPSKSNPARLLHGFVLDYDMPLEAQRVADAISKMSIKPAYWERSLGGNVRLVWTLNRPLLVEDNDFAGFILNAALKWLKAELLPGLDAPAAVDPCRTYCNGGEWHKVGGPIPDNVAQAFYVDCGQAYSFTPLESGYDIPLDVAERRVIELFPGFSWPGEFAVESQGPTFWVPESESAMSAIVKKGGMFTFSSHAPKPFFSWPEILGKEFCDEYKQNTIAIATADKFYDGRMYWRKFPALGRFLGETKDDFVGHLRVDCRVSTKPDKTTGLSMLDLCLSHVRGLNRVEGGAPFLFLPPGVVDYNGKRFVNTAKPQMMNPAEQATKWGESGQFPFLSRYLENFFDPADQLDPFLAWFQHFYKSALAGTPRPGQNIFLAGGVGIGKTLLNRNVIGQALGGFVDARDYIMGDDAFGSDLFHAPVWSIDDETVAENDGAHRTFTAMVKKIAANQAFRYHKKFETPHVIPWMGRIIITLNLDEASSRTLPAMDTSILEKVSLFRCVETRRIDFPDRYVLEPMITRELPHFLRWIVDWTPPAELKGEDRFGVKPFHEPSLVDRAHQSSASAPFKELLIELLSDYFKQNPKDTELVVSCTALYRLLQNNPMNASLMRNIRISQVNRFLESLAKEGVLECASETSKGSGSVRVWKFPRLVIP